MSYEAITIKDIVTRITNNEAYLPAIQRKFVWTHEQIESLFDSLMMGYPIGTFLFWDVPKDLANEYVFYRFIQHYHERDRNTNELAPSPEMKERILGVLDGQQRLSSLYLSLQGSYAHKKRRARWDNDDAFPKRHLFLNLLSRNESPETGDLTYEFKFLTSAESEIRKTDQFWFPVKEALKWGGANDYIKFANENKLMANETAIDILTVLWQRITQDKVINFFRVDEPDLDSVLEIFVRVNSGGTQLSKSDLLFSTIVATWESAREEVEELIASINRRGSSFDFDTDYIMRTCLVLTDNSVLFNVNNFKKDNVLQIKADWPRIKDAIRKMVDLLVDFGFNKETLTSKNATIPIVYHLFHDGKTDDKNSALIRRYLVLSLLKQIYGGKGDRVLESIRSVLKASKGSDFPLSEMVRHKLPQEKSLIFTDDDIDEVFEYKKGPYTFMVLSLLYPSLKLGQITFHQDHIHPASSFSDAKLKKAGVQEDKYRQFRELRDTLGNLQLLEGGENESKNKTPFSDWFQNTVMDKDDYRFRHFIPSPSTISYDLSGFIQFYEQRRQLLRTALTQALE